MIQEKYEYKNQDKHDEEKEIQVTLGEQEVAQDGHDSEREEEVDSEWIQS